MTPTITTIGKNGKAKTKAKAGRKTTRKAPRKRVAAKAALVEKTAMNLGHLRPVTLPISFYSQPLSQMTEIRLHGRLGRKFGREHRMSVRSVREVISAIEAKQPGFRNAIREMKGVDFAIHVGKKNIGETELDMPTSGRAISIRPVVRGSGSGKGWLQVVAGVVLIIVGIILTAIPFTSAIGPYVIYAGIGLTLGGISALIAGTPDVDTGANDKTKTSYQFGGAVNVAQQGAPAALAYGRVFTGSIIGSSSISSKDVTTGTTATIPGSGGTGAGGIPFGWGGDSNKPQYMPMKTRAEIREAMGAGGQIAIGAGGGGDSGGSAVEDPDTLASTSYAAIKDIIGEGPIRGLVNGMQSVYLDDTPLENPDGGSIGGINIVSGSKTITSPTGTILIEHAGRGISGPGLPVGCKINIVTPSGSSSTATLSSAATATTNGATVVLTGTFNFPGFAFDFRTGTQDQTYITGFDSEEATSGQGLQLKQSPAKIYDFTNPNLDAIRVDMRFPKLEKQDKDDGDLHGSSVRLTFELKVGSLGAWVTKIDDTIIGKASNPYVRTYKIDIDPATKPGPWSIRITRITEDSKDATLANDTYIDSTTEVIYGKLRHPNTTYGAISFDAEHFSAIPVRTYHIDGLMVKVPINYDPDTHVYTGAWSGVFKVAWTCNPAWVLYDLLTNNRYGLGRYIPATGLDKYAFYTTGQYCDEIVPDGFGGNERRFECHAYIAGRKAAYEVVSDIAGIFNAQAAYLSGVIVPVQDRFVPEAQYSGIYNATNVDDFNFATLSRRTQTTAVLMEWNDPLDFGRPRTEYVDDQDEVNRIGFHQKRVTAMGCYSRGQAHRRARWMLLNEKERGEICSFRTGLEGATHLPGDVIELSATFRVGKTLSGRVASATTNTVTMDREITLLSGKYYVVTIYRVDGATFDAPVLNSPGTYTVLNVATLFSAVATDSAFILIEGTLIPEPYRVLGVSSLDNLRSEVTCLAYDPSLYDAVDQGTDLDPGDYSDLPPVSFCAKPGKITTTLRVIASPQGGVQQVIELTWVASVDKFLRNYIVSYRVNQGNWIEFPATVATVFDVPTGQTGTYDFQVVAYNTVGAPSLPSLATYFLGAGNPITEMSVTGLELVGQGASTIFQQRDAKFGWRLNSPTLVLEPVDDDGIQDGIDDPMFQSFIVKIFLADVLIWGPIYPKEPSYIFTQELNQEAMGNSDPTPTFRIEVQALDIYNNESAAATLTVTNPPPSTPVNFLVLSSFKSAFLSWGFSVDVDLYGILIYRGPTSDFNASKLIASVSVGTIAFTDSGLVSGQTYNYFLVAIDTFGSYSAPTLGAQVTPGTVDATDIDDFAIDATKVFGNTVVVWGDLWYDNSTDQGVTTTAGYISWNAHSVFWKGIEFLIAKGSTNRKYVYWRGDPARNGTEEGQNADADASYRTSDVNPIDIAGLAPVWSNNSDFQIGININGAHELAWYGFANAVIGSAYIGDAAITNAKIALLAVDDANIVSLHGGKIIANTIATAGLMAQAVTTDKLTVGLGAALNLNPSFEEDDGAATPIPIMWTLINGAFLVIDTGLTGVSHSGIKSINTSSTLSTSGVRSSVVIPVRAGQKYMVQASVRTSQLTQQIRIGVRQFTQDGGTPSGVATKFKIGLFNALIPGAATATWYPLTYPVTVDSDCFYVMLEVEANVDGAVSGATMRIDDVMLLPAIPNDQVALIVNGIIQSSNFVAGSVGWQIDLLGDAEFNKVVIRDSISYKTLLVPTFTNDYDAVKVELLSRTYNDLDALSIRPYSFNSKIPSGTKLRYETNRMVTSASPFWPWYPASHGGNTNGDGTGPNDFLGIILSDGGNRTFSNGVSINGSKTYTSALTNGANFLTTDVGKFISGTNIPANTFILKRNSATSIDLSNVATAGGSSLPFTIIARTPNGFPFTTTFHACEVSAPNYNILGPEAVIMLTWTPVDVNTLPVLDPPYIYVHSTNAVALGALNYKVAADSADPVATILQSANGTVFSAYTRGAVATRSTGLIVGENVYFKATRPGYKDSPIASLANTASGLPNAPGPGGDGSGGDEGTVKARPY